MATEKNIIPFVRFWASDKTIDNSVIRRIIGANAVSIILISFIKIEKIHRAKILKVVKINVLNKISNIIF